MRKLEPAPAVGPISGGLSAGIRYTGFLNDYIQRYLAWMYAENLGYKKGYIYDGIDGKYHCTICPHFRTVKVTRDRANVIPWTTAYFQHWETHTAEVLDRIDELPEYVRNDLVKLLMEAEFNSGKGVR